MVDLGSKSSFGLFDGYIFLFEYVIGGYFDLEIIVEGGRSLAGMQRKGECSQRSEGVFQILRIGYFRIAERPFIGNALIRNAFHFDPERLVDQSLKSPVGPVHRDIFLFQEITVVSVISVAAPGKKSNRKQRR